MSDEEQARWAVPRPDYMRELEPGVSGYFRSLPIVAELDPVTVCRNRDLIERRKPVAGERPPANERRKTG